MKSNTEVALNANENALVFALQKYSVNQNVKNAEEVVNAAICAENTNIPEIKKAAKFFKDGNFNNGERCTIANKMVKDIQRFISKSMNWLSSTLDFYNISR